VLLLGIVAFATVAPMQMRVLQQAGAQGAILASSLNIAAFNLGNALGAWVGGLVLPGIDLPAVPGLVCAALTVVGLLLVGWSQRLPSWPAPCPWPWWATDIAPGNRRSCTVPGHDRPQWEAPWHKAWSGAPHRHTPGCPPAHHRVTLAGRTPWPAASCRVGRPWAFLGPRQHRRQRLAGVGAGRTSSSGVPAATMRPPPAAFGAQVDDPVGLGDHVEVVLDHHHAVAAVHQAVQHADELVHVGHVQAHGGLVQHIQRVRRLLAAPDVVAHLGQLGHQLDALGLAADSVGEGWPSVR
jgi:DHA1 family inner membrane transport protein